MSYTPEQEARIEIDRMLVEAGWLVQDVKNVNLHAGRGVAIREFPLERGFGFADYLLYIDGKAAGVIEAKKAGLTLSGVEIQSDRYTQGLPLTLPAWFRPLPFRYQSTGVEPVGQLLKRILAERCAKWEESIEAKVGAKQGVSASPGFGDVGNNVGNCIMGEAGESFASPLPKMTAKGTKPKDVSWKKKYKEPAGLDQANLPELPELPEGWVWTRLENVAEVVDPHPSHRTPATVTNGASYIGMGDITSEGKIDFQQARKIAHEVLIEHKERYSLKLGDFIFGKIGTIGKPVKLYGPFEYALSANVILVQPIPNATDPDYCFTFMASPLMDTVIKKESKATTQAAFGIQKVRLIAYPYPPQCEQKEIRNEVDRRLSVTEEIEATIKTNIKRAERLRQIILQQAFSGGVQ